MQVPLLALVPFSRMSLLLLVDALKTILAAGLILALSRLIITSLIMPKIFWLIALFVQVAFLLLLHGIEFVSFVILLLYVGAISVLFLFVVMILNPDTKRELVARMEIEPRPIHWSRTYHAHLVAAATFGFSLCAAEVVVAEYYKPLAATWAQAWPVLAGAGWVPAVPVTTVLTEGLPVGGLTGTSDMWIIAQSLYTEDFVAFWLVGLILLVAMIGAIVLTLTKSRGLKRQKGMTQMKRYYAQGR